MNIAEANAAQSAFFKTHKIENARPEWDDLTRADRDAERAKSSDSAYFEHFEVGECRDGCGGNAGTILDDDGFCVVCGGVAAGRWAA